MGLELVRQLSPVSNLVLATCRNPENATELTSIADKNDNVIIKKLDIENLESFATFVEDLKNSVAQVEISSICHFREVYDLMTLNIICSLSLRIKPWLF